jgi:hypothetical protein
MFQAFYLDVAKVDFGVAHVAMVTHAFQVFHLSSDVCYKCLIWMFPKVDLVLHVLQWRRWLATTFSLSANSLISATALSWSPAALAPRPPGTTQLKGMAA